ncbi:MAG TPA: GNAT family N-acetyltransferase [Kofleriaceae bacterium]|nr:GNAT family N-acetyltransferase [Kofleriaceae bacterium]
MARLELLAVEHGAVARRDGVVVASLRGELRTDERRGRQVWISADGDASAFAELYALAAAPWVDGGYRAHQVIVDANDREAIDVWFALCFGREQVHAEQAVRAPAELPRSVAVRPGSIDDAVAFGDVTGAYLAGPPVWSPLPRWRGDELRDTWVEALAEPGAIYLVAEVEGKRAAYSLLQRGDDDDAATLAVFATVPALRGRGVGHALFEAVMGRAHAAGFRRLVTDWRSTNLLAARFWTGRGFVPTRYRLHRLVESDHRVSSSLT